MEARPLRGAPASVQSAARGQDARPIAAAVRPCRPPQSARSAPRPAPGATRSSGRRRWPISCCACRCWATRPAWRCCCSCCWSSATSAATRRCCSWRWSRSACCGVARAADPLALFLAGWRRGASYGAFFFALTTLRDAAETSPLVRRCGQHLVAQPPGRRYAALTGGGHLFGIILSYGAIELLAAMVMRANTAGSRRRLARGARAAGPPHADGDLSRLLRDELLESDQPDDRRGLHRSAGRADAAAVADRVRRVGRHGGAGLAGGPRIRGTRRDARRRATGNRPSAGPSICASSPWSASVMALAELGSVGLRHFAGDLRRRWWCRWSASAGSRCSRGRLASRSLLGAALQRRVGALPAARADIPQRGDGAGGLRLHGRRGWRRVAGERPGAADRPSAGVGRATAGAGVADRHRARSA